MLITNLLLLLILCALTGTSFWAIPLTIGALWLLINGGLWLMFYGLDLEYDRKRWGPWVVRGVAKTVGFSLVAIPYLLLCRAVL